MHTNDNPHVTALKLIRPYIAEKKEHYLCLALKYQVAHDPRIDIKVRDAAWDIRRWIYKQLNGSHGVDYWLKERGINLTAKNLQKYRLAWIDHLIERWSKE